MWWMNEKVKMVLNQPRVIFRHISNTELRTRTGLDLLDVMQEGLSEEEIHNLLKDTILDLVSGYTVQEIISVYEDGDRWIFCLYNEDWSILHAPYEQSTCPHITVKPELREIRIPKPLGVNFK